MFKKYPSIENSYNQKKIDRFLRDFPILKNEQYIVTEKRDGSNIQIIFTPSEKKKFKIGSRNRVLSRDEDFNDVWNVIKKYDELISYGKHLSQIHNSVVTFYGEIFGKGIQKRINYGDEKYIEIFDIAIDGELMPQMFLVEDPILYKYMVPVYSLLDGIQNALDFEPDNFNEIEGVVIKPYNEVYKSVQGKTFFLKKKNPKFEEKGNKQKKSNKPSYSEEAQNLREEFERYVNKNRVLSVFSKEGEIEDNEQIGKYIKLTLEDAKEDFFNDGFSIDNFDKNEVKYIFNTGSKIVEILKEYL